MNYVTYVMENGLGRGNVIQLAEYLPNIQEVPGLISNNV